MFERVDVAAASHQQASIDELGQGGAERGLVHVENGRQQPRRELAADGGADLDQILGGSQVIEPGHEGVPQTRRNGKRTTRCDQRETLGRIAQHA